MTRTAAAVATVVLAMLSTVAAARADGEAGLVIQEGGSVRTFCVPFEGESISGEALLRAAGLSFDQFGGGTRVLCSIDNVGCFDASSFESCFCQCKAGSGSCTYWAFFTQRYATSWAYSTVGFNVVRARDGDLHGWKWGEGGPQSAPAPLPISFEDVCGHPPRGGAAVATAPPTLATTATATPTPAAVSPGTPISSPAAPGITPTVATGATTPTPLVPADATPSQPALTTPSVAAPATPFPTITITVGRTPSPLATDQPEAASGDSGPGSTAGGIVAFIGVAGILVAAIVAGLAWRTRHGR